MNNQASPSWFCQMYEEQDDIEGYILWIRTIMSKPRIKNLERFVAEELGNRGIARFVDVKRGSLNVVFQFELSDGKQVALRLPRPRHPNVDLLEEKIENEVHWMQYLEEHDVLKVPHVYTWSKTRGGPDDDIGPYILMDYEEGKQLEECLKDWRTDTPENIEKRDIVYEQLAEMFCKLYRHKFDRIGSIAKTPEGQWAITQRPLTLDMYQQVLGIPGFSTDAWPTSPLLRSQDYKALVVDLLKYQLQHLRNLNIPAELSREIGDYVQQEGDKINIALAMDIARGRFIARHAFAMPAATSFLGNSDDGPFVVFNRDLCSRNILVDPQTAKITAVVDFEFTNTMPAAFAHDPPMWLLPYALEKVLDLDLLPWWMQTFDPVVEQFVAAMKRVEARQQEEEQQSQEPPLSDLMRESWKSKQYLINFAFHRSEYLDALYCALPEIFPKVDIDPLMREQMETYVAFTKRQIAAYEEDRVGKEKRE